MEKTYPVVTNAQELTEALERCRQAQKVFASYSQEQVDKIFKAAAIAANKMRIPLAKMAVAETGMGVVEDKVIKNHYAAEYIYNAYKDTKTCGVLETDEAYGIQRIAEPIGVIAAVIPTTNPTSTAIFKTLICLKTRNAIVISPHPRAKACTIAAAKVVLEAAVEAGAPEGIIGWIDVPSLELTNQVMREADLILATGGPGMVKAAYSSGKPALGVGAHIASKREEHAINRVNSLHSQMRHFIGRFRGVSTRRLENYLAWFKWTWCFKVRRSADELAELIVRQAARGTYEKTWRQYKVTPYPFYEYWIKQAKWDSRARRAIYGVA